MVRARLARGRLLLELVPPPQAAPQRRLAWALRRRPVARLRSVRGRRLRVEVQSQSLAARVPQQPAAGFPRPLRATHKGPAAQATPAGPNSTTPGASPPNAG